MERKDLEGLYNFVLESGNSTSHHMPTIRRYAEKCESAIETGVNMGGSTLAILSGCGHLTSYDIEKTDMVVRIRDAAGERWTFKQMDGLEGKPHSVDLLMLDSVHNYDHVSKELAHFGPHIRRFMIFHDTITFGVYGAPRHNTRADKRVKGIRLAIDEWMIRHQQWRLVHHDPESHGLLVLEARP